MKSIIKDNDRIVLQKIRSLNIRRATTLMAALLVLLLTLHVLILQTSALTQDEAERQGGIDFSVSEQTKDPGDADAEKDDAEVQRPEADSDASEEAATQRDSDKQTRKSQKNEKIDSVKCEGDGFTMSVENAVLPADTELSVTELEENDREYKEYYDAALKAVRKDAGKDSDIQDLDFARVFDVSLDVDGTSIYPDQGMDATISLLKGQKTEDQDGVRVIRFVRDGEKDKLKGEVLDPEEVELAFNKKGKLEEAAFAMDGVASYAIVGATVLTGDVLASDGKNYRITVTAPAEAGIPQDAELQVAEISKGSKEYQNYRKKTAEALDMDSEEFAYEKFLDITILKDGKEIQPKAKVDVKIELADTESKALSVVHFGHSTEVLDSKQKAVGDGVKVTFATGSFSVYAIVEAPAPYQPENTGEQQVTSLGELTNDGQGFFIALRNTSGKYYYAKSGLKTITAKDQAYKYLPTTEENTTNGRVAYYFEKAADNKNYHIYYEDDGVRHYLRMKGEGSGEFLDAVTDVEFRSTFSVTQNNNGKFNITLAETGANRAWNLKGNGSKQVIQGYSDPTDIEFIYAPRSANDPYNLNGKTYAIAFNNESTTAVALGTGTVKNAPKRLSGLALVIKPDIQDNDGMLLMAKSANAVEWTFESAGGDEYYIRTITSAGTKYLTINNDTLSLEDTGTKIKATPGEGEHAGKWQFTVGNYVLNCVGKAGTDGFSAVKTSTNSEKSWMNLVKKTTLKDDSFEKYNARKVSVSDGEAVYDTVKSGSYVEGGTDENGAPTKSQVVIYTRVWNDELKKYEFFAVDHDGSLIRAYDAGDVLEWVGTKVNTALWEFTEYCSWDKNKGELAPNGYYELKNISYNEFIAPQVTGGQILSDNTLGLNLTGRTSGKDFTKILAWDDDNYRYVGLKVEDGHVVACPMDQADDFYFAVVTPSLVNNPTEFTEVKTIDNDDYGISMKMQNYDYNASPYYIGGLYREKTQTDVLGLDTDNAGLLKPYLEDSGADAGFPRTVSARTTKDETSLHRLYNATNEVNHLFLESIHKESGYFEYDSTENFAELDGSSFKVYDQLGTNGNRTHGQFMPYNHPDPTHVGAKNTTDLYYHDLSDLNVRKDENLYWIDAKYPGGNGNLVKPNQADYFFGMQLDARFTQTESGLDNWGHDIIFEFSGDDDFWLYVDGMLVIDLGGVHTARSGKVNFRTGDVEFNKSADEVFHTNLREMFKTAYEAKYPEWTPAEIEAKLDSIFKENEAGVKTVFNDYSNHDMKVFYMERGAGSSNLHMRFNLASVKPGNFILKKKLSGTDDPNNGLLEFPYQVFYRTSSDPEGHYNLLTEKDSNDKYCAHYEGTSKNVKFAASFTPAGGMTEDKYQNVFFLKPGESAEFTMPKDTVDYYVKECAINPDIYDRVSANGTQLDGVTPEDYHGTPARKDFATSRETLEKRPRVEYDNHVAPGAMRTLTFHKALYDKDGTTRLTYAQDKTPFMFRLYLGNENASDSDLPLANMYPYSVKNKDGYYCRYNEVEKKFESIGKKDYDQLTAEDKNQVIFHTSQYGSISKIPVDHTVEVRNLIIDSKFKLEERDWEIPKGYTRREADGYVRTDCDPDVKQSAPISGRIVKDNDPNLEVRNQIGWGLTVKKVWTDKDFMAHHDPVYFAVYLKTNNGDVLLQDKVRQWTDSTEEIYYFFLDLQYQGTAYKFEDYVIKEVTLGNENPTVDSDTGVVTNYGTVTPVENGGKITVNGKLADSPLSGDEPFEYTVKYQVGENTGYNANIRTDIATNSRPGFKMYKTDVNGEPLEGAVFRLQKQGASDFRTFKTGKDGLITIMYLPKDTTYTLTETKAPKGYKAMTMPITIKSDADGKVTFTGGENGMFVRTNDETGEMEAIIKIKNKSSELKVLKVDRASGDPLAGVHFQLLQRVTDNQNHTTDQVKLQDVVSGDDGILPGLDLENLKPGTYVLHEKEDSVLADYVPLAADIVFTIDNDGSVTLARNNNGNLQADSNEGKVSYTIRILNEPVRKLQIMKYDSTTQEPLAGALFALYKKDDFDTRTNAPKKGKTPVWSNSTGTGDDGIISITGVKLAWGTYYLVETNAPDGYNLPEDPIEIKINENGVSYQQGIGQPYSADCVNGVYQISVPNSPGVELPHTGGAGTTGLYLAGILLILLSGGALLIRRRRNG